MTKMAKTQARPEYDPAVTDRSPEKLTRIARATAGASADAARESLPLAQSTTQAAAEELYETAHKSAEGSTEIAGVFVGLIGEQTRQSVDTFSAFARAVNWSDLANAQSKLFADSLLRISQFNARYREFLLRGAPGIASLSRR